MTDKLEGDKYLTLHMVWPIYLELLGLLAEQPDDDDNPTISKLKYLGRKYMEKNRGDMEPAFAHKFMTFLNPLMKKLKRISNDDRSKLHAEIQDYMDNNPVTTTVNESESVLESVSTEVHFNFIILKTIKIRNP